VKGVVQILTPQNGPKSYNTTELSASVIREFVESMKNILRTTIKVI
jgi:hypothetical protein